MRILFVSGTLPPDATAVGNIIRHILPSLENENVVVEGVTGKKSLLDDDITYFHSMKIYHANYVFYKIVTPKTVKSLVWNAVRNAEMLYHKIVKKQGFYDVLAVKPIVRMLKKIKAKDYDAIIPICANYTSMEAVYRYYKKCPKEAKVYLYQVDPLSEREFLQGNRREYLRKREQQYFDICQKVFTVPQQYSQKVSEGFFSKDKMLSLEIPAIIYNDKVVERKNNDGEIVCVFAGFLYGKIRDASYTLQMFANMENKNFHLFVIGKGQEDLLASYKEGALKGRLHILGSLPKEECDDWLNRADVLVNVGNTVLNQVPSKIFDYLSLGKPILNVCVSSQCPSLDYLAKYPLAVNVIQSDNAKSSARDITERLVELVGKKIDFELVKKEYYKNTPDFFVKQILDTLTL